jgi:hypothetical protein
VRLDVGVTDRGLTQEGQFTLKGLNFGPSEGLADMAGLILLYSLFVRLSPLLAPKFSISDHFRWCKVLRKRAPWRGSLLTFDPAPLPMRRAD